MRKLIVAVVDRYKIGMPQLIMVGTITCGIFMVLFFKFLTNTYATFLTLAMMAPFMMLIVGNSKRFLLVLLALFLNITVDITIGGTNHISGASGYMISAFDIVLAVLYMFWIGEMVCTKSISVRFFPEISIPALFFFGTAFVSMFFARFPQLSLFEIIEILKMYLCFLFLANNIRNEGELRFVVALLVVSFLFEGILGFAQRRFGEPFIPTSLGGPRWIDSRISGSWVSYNDFAWYITFMLPIALSLVFSGIKPVYKVICGLAFLLGSGSLLWTSSRAGWISIFMAVLFVIFFLFSKLRNKYALIRTFLSIIAILILFSPLFPRLSTKIYERFTADDKGSAESRVEQFDIAFNIISDYPLIGVGINNFTEVMYEYDTKGEGLESLTPHAVHNIFLHILAEMGIFGIIGFFWLIATIFHEGMKYIVINKDMMVYVVIGMLGGIFAFLIHGLADTASPGSKLYLFVWFFTGLIFAIKNIKTIRHTSL